MRKNEFLQAAPVLSFVEWAANELRRIRVNLNIRHSPKVPGGIGANVMGLSAVLAEYRWRPAGVDAIQHGTWSETVAHLSSLREALEVARNDEELFLACGRIFRWGGERRVDVGARPFLRQMANDGVLGAYLTGARRRFALQDANLADGFEVTQMNAMLTKVHALYSTDGLPIYDSRVAAAIATLVELWRIQCGIGGPLPDSLAFPSTDRNRTVRRRFEHAELPRHLSYAPDYQERTAREWAEAKVRLAWLMQAILERDESLFAEEDEIGRMHSFEASLFMIGYDVSCLAPVARA